MFHDQLEKILSALASRKGTTRDHLFEMIARQTGFLRAKSIRFRIWIDGRHTPLRFWFE
jgi:hypothetical protein